MSLTYFDSMDIKIVPILVGTMNKTKEKEYGSLLAPHLSRPDTFCIVSSDFCHWCVASNYIAVQEDDITPTHSIQGITIRLHALLP